MLKFEVKRLESLTDVVVEIKAGQFRNKDDYLTTHFTVIMPSPYDNFIEHLNYSLNALMVALSHLKE